MTPTPGSLVRVAGHRGWFRVKGVFERDGSLTVFGPVFKNGCPTPRAKMRAFVASSVQQTRGAV